MKRLLYILSLLMATTCFAVDTSCPGWFLGLPDHYCECTTTSQTFQFPLKVEVGATPRWFSATVDDMRQGICAYWVSDDTISFEIYAFCSSDIPTITMSVGPNQMREMSAEAVNSKLEAAGNIDLSVMTPRIRVYTAHGRTGTVYCYPYDQGPVSTCDTLLRVLPRMTYVCDQPEEVYILRPQNMSSLGNGFIRWKEKKNRPANFRLTVDSCNGREIANFTLSDSLRVYVLNKDTMKAIRNAGDSIFVHVSHDSAYVGRMIYRNTIKWDNQIIDTVLCQGKVLELPDTTLAESTTYSGDTLWRKADTLALTGYRLTITPPELKYDTLLLNKNNLPYSYRNNIIPKDGWGDYDFTIHQTDQCDEHYLLHVAHKFVTKTTVVNDTLCLGKTKKIGNVTYSTDTVFQDTVWTYGAKNTNAADTRTIRDVTLHFTEPELEYDTIDVPSSQMTARGYYYGILGVFVHYGDTMIVKKRNNTCTRYIQLHVGQDVVMITGDVDTTACVGKSIVFGDVVCTTDTMFYDTVQVDADTWMMGNITVHFTEPELEYDTVVIAPSLMTPEGYMYEALGAQVFFGDTLITKAEEDMCTRRIQLHVAWDDTPIVTEVDTTLCLGKTVVLGDVAYAADTVVRDSAWIEPGLWEIHQITLHFTNPEMEYDTIRVTPEEGVPAGDTLIVVTEENECTRWIMRHVEVTEGIDSTLAPSAGVYKYLYNGTLYIRREEQDYDLLGRPIYRQ